MYKHSLFSLPGGAALVVAAGAFVACGTFDEAAVEPGPEDSGAVAETGADAAMALDGGSGVDAADAHADADVSIPVGTCAESCDTSGLCCVTAGAAECATKDTCAGIAMGCDATTVCPMSQRCCFHASTGTASCDSNCTPINFIVCDLTTDCGSSETCDALRCVEGDGRDFTPFKLCANGSLAPMQLPTMTCTR